MSRVVDAQPAEDRPFACPLGTLATDLKHSQEYRPALAAAFRIWEGHLAASLVAALQGGYLLASVHGRIEIMRDVLDDAVAALRRYQV